MRPDGGDGPVMVGINPQGIAVLTQRVQSAAGDLNTAASDLRSALNSIALPTGDASTIGEVSSWLSGQVAGLNRRHAIATEAGRATPWVTEPSGMVWVEQAAVDRFPTIASATAAANADANNLKKELSSGKTDPDTTLNIMLSEDDPYYAVAFANAMGPAALANVANQLNDQRQEVERNASNLGPTFIATLDNLKTQSGALLQAVDTTFATATRGSSDDQLPANFAGDLVKEVPYNAFGVSELLRFGNYDTKFLGTVANGVYSYEQQNAYGKGFWAGKAPKDESGGLPYTDDDDHGFYDPMVGVMTALGHNPDAAQNFLSNPDTLHYFTVTRVWTSDQGNAFGNALEAATTTYRDHDPDGPGGAHSKGYISAQIAAQAIHDLGGDGGGRMYDGMRDSVGNILASYIGDVDTAALSTRSVSGPGVNGIANSDMPQPQPWGADFSIDDLRGVMSTAFKDSGAFQTVSAAATAYESTYFNQVALKVAGQAGPGLATTGSLGLTAGQMAEFDTAAAHASATLGLIVKSGNLASIQLADSSDANAQSWLDLADSGLDLIDVPGGKFVEFGVSQVKDQVFSRLEPDKGGAARTNANSANDVTKTLLEDMAASAMARNGLFGAPGPPPAQTSPVAAFPAGTAASFVNADGSILSWKSMTPVQQQAYTEWIGSSASAFGGVRTTIDSAFNNMIQEYGDK